MGPKQYTENIIVITSQYLRTDLTKKLFKSLRQDNIKFTSLVAFDGSPRCEMLDLLDDIDIALFFKKAIHSTPEIINQLFNFAKLSDAEFVMFCDNDIEFKAGSFKKLVDLMKDYDVVSPIKIDSDYEKFKSYESNENPIEVIGSNDSVWFFRLSKLALNPLERTGPFNFEDVALNYNLMKNNAKFVVDPQAVVFHKASQETGNCFTVEDRQKYSSEWDLKKELFLKDGNLDKKWFFDNVTMNSKAIKKFGFPAYIL